MFREIKIICVCWYIICRTHPFKVALVIKNLPANARDIRDADSIPGVGRSPGGGHDNPFKYSCLENPENPMDRGAFIMQMNIAD